MSTSNRSTTNSIYIYSWSETEEDYAISLRAYGMDANNLNSCIRITNFLKRVYIQLPEMKFEWDSESAKTVETKIRSMLYSKNGFKNCKLVFRRKLYYASIDEKSGKFKTFPFLECAFSRLSDIKKISYELRNLKNTINVPGIGNIVVKMHEDNASSMLQLCCERNIPTIGWVKIFGLKCTSDETKLTLCDNEYMVSCSNITPISADQTLTIPDLLCMSFDIETYSSNPNKMPSAELTKDKVFQISCVFNAHGKSVHEKILLTLGNPDPAVVGEGVSIFAYKTEDDMLMDFVNIIREKKPNVVAGYNIFGFDIPYMIDRLEKGISCSCIREWCVQGFHKYRQSPFKTIRWSSSAFKNQEFRVLEAEGVLHVDLLPIVRRDYKLDNYRLKTVSEYFLGPENTKDPLTYKDIFRAYEEAVVKKSKDGPRLLGECGKYVVQDSMLVAQLMNTLDVVIGLSEMASICNTSMFALYTQGQQIRVFSQIYRHCYSQQIVVERDGYKVGENERYLGAYVIEPVPGVYDQVVPFDFQSMLVLLFELFNCLLFNNLTNIFTLFFFNRYPSTIIAYNIDFSTMVVDPTIPDSMCNVFAFEDHVGCEHDPKMERIATLTAYIDDVNNVELKRLRIRLDNAKSKADKQAIRGSINTVKSRLKPYQVERSNLRKGIPKFVMCEKRNFRFLKEPKGIMPTVIQNLLDARKRTRAVIKENTKKIESGSCDKSTVEKLRLMNRVLDKKQLGFKVSSNSMYGAMGVKQGPLAFMPGAMCTTFMCRENIKIVAKQIPETFGGKLVYGDTDSCYVHFPKLHNKHPSETWSYATQIAEHISGLFPKPLKLEFEQVIYFKFFILSKKRYLYNSCDQKGNVSSKIGNKGVLLARRDNSPVVRDMYRKLVSGVLDQTAYSVVEESIIGDLNRLCSNQFELSKFIITKSVGSISVDDDTNEYKLEKVEGSTEKSRIGDYKVTTLSADDERRTDQMRLKKAETDTQYYLRSLPAQVQLAEKMRKRGFPVDAGSRIEYVIIQSKDNIRDRQYEKIESFEYVARHKAVLKIDFLYYLKLMCVPFDEIMGLVYAKPSFMKDQLKMRTMKAACNEEIVSMTIPRLVLKTF
jgi:DNA polymerase elongation subunit (family B)